MTAEQRDALILGTQDLVPKLVQRAIQRYRLPEQSREDLVSAGNGALIEASMRFDPSRGVAFAAYARPRIVGEILDELRRAKTLAGDLRESPDQVASGSPNPEESAIAGQEAKRLAELMGTLDSREKRLLAARYREGLTLEEIAKQEGISKSWATRIHTRALERMKRRDQDAGQEQ
jgi:RNA polymerase sigma factor (sigma-70 family)